MHVDNAANTLGLTGVATALYPNGPFFYKKSIYPDAPVEAPGELPVREAHDLTVIVDPETRAAFFVKTFFKDINYWLPRPVMQPLWESINLLNGENGTDFALSYHRGMYHRGYDDPEDIYLQRWRAEEVAWNHTCCWPDGRCDDHLYQAKQDIFIRTPDTLGEYSDEMYRAPYTYGNCPFGTVKRVLGQATNAELQVETKFFDPSIDRTNAWQADSVPPFSPWGYQVYNVKLWKEDYFQAISTDIVKLLFNRFDIDHNGFLSANDINLVVTDRMFEFDKELYVVLDFLGIEYTLRTRARYDPDYNMQVTLDEFRKAFGRDPDLLFDKYDGDKSSFLNVTEIEAVITELGVPRKMKKRYEDGGMATIGDFWTMKALDANDDEEIFYNAFERWLENAPTSIFDLYDTNADLVLTAGEMATLISDLGMPVSHTDLVTLDRDGQGRVTFDDFALWLRSYPSRLRNVREFLKVNNAPTPAYADELVGPMQVVLTRRSKYIAVNEMSLDYEEVGRLVLEVEGEYFGGGSDNLISALGKMDLNNWGIRQAMQPAPVHSRISLSPNELGFDSASYFNGREFERHQEAKAEFTYGRDCVHISGVEDGCPPALTHSPYLSSAQEYYDNYKTVIERQDWIDKGAADARYECFGDRRLCDRSLFNPQGRTYTTVTEGVDLWNPQRQYAGIWGVEAERKRLFEARNETNTVGTNSYPSTPYNYKAYYHRDEVEDVVQH
jgi:Ca2+-binding EF-hand superfamily protein